MAISEAQHESKKFQIIETTNSESADVIKNTEMPKIVNTESINLENSLANKELTNSTNKHNIPEISITNKLPEQVNKVTEIRINPPPKRNVAIKNTSAAIHKQYQKYTESRKHNSSHFPSKYRLSDDDNMVLNKI